MFLPGKFHRQRSLAGYSPLGHKESDRTEWLTLSFSVFPITEILPLSLVGSELWSPSSHHQEPQLTGQLKPQNHQRQSQKLLHSSSLGGSWKMQLSPWNKARFLSLALFFECTHPVPLSPRESLRFLTQPVKGGLIFCFQCKHADFKQSESEERGNAILWRQHHPAKRTTRGRWSVLGWVRGNLKAVLLSGFVELQFQPRVRTATILCTKNSIKKEHWCQVFTEHLWGALLDFLQSLLIPCPSFFLTFLMPGWDCISVKVLIYE